jgi:hypothetical protein
VSLTKALSVASSVLLLALAGGATGDTAGAALPPPVISDLHVTNFDPFAGPAGGFDSQGFDFENQFTNNKFTLTVGGYSLAFDRTYGLCGGMVYAALDTFLAGNGTTTPEGSSAGPALGPGLLGPPDSGPVFNYLYTRELNSLEANNFASVREMLHMMVLDPYESERERETSHYFGAITTSVNAGQPVPLLLVEALSPGQVFDNHQVLATGYFYRGGPQGQLVVQIYDPNFPGRFMYLNTHNTYGNMSQYPSEIETYDAAGSEYSGVHFYGFFTTPYSYVAPPWALAKPAGNLLNDPGADWSSSVWNLTTVDGVPPGGLESPEPQLGATPGSASVTAPPDWSPSGNFTAVQYGTAPRRPPVLGTVPTFLSTTYATGISGGTNYFAGGPDNSASGATQVIDLDSDAPLDAQIDGGDQVATLSGDLGGSGSGPAEMVVTASYLSAAGASLGSLSIGPVSAADRNDHTELLARSATAIIPKHTRTIDVTMSAGGGAAGQYDTAFADNLSLTIATNVVTFPTVPVTIHKP